MLLHQIYAEQMKNNPYGIALYHPESNAIIRPGMCGYLNDLGRWNPVVDLTDEEELRANGYTLLSSSIQRAPPGSESWGPKCSMSVTSRKLDLSAGTSAAPAGFPVGASAFYEFSTSSAYGAILTTSSPITREFFYHEAPFRNWCRENSEMLFRNRPELRDYQLWIVTSTYAAKECSLNASLNKSRATTLVFAVDAIHSGEIAPSGSAYHASADSGWIRFLGKIMTQDSHTPAQSGKVNEGDANNAVGKLKSKHQRKHRRKALSERPPAATRNSTSPGSQSQEKQQEENLGNDMAAPMDSVNKDLVVVFMGGLRFSCGSHPWSQTKTLVEIRPRSWRKKSWDCCINVVSFCVLIILSIITLGTLPLFLWRRRQRVVASPGTTGAWIELESSQPGKQSSKPPLSLKFMFCLIAVQNILYKEISTSNKQ